MCALNVRIELRSLMDKITFAEYTPPKFPAIIWKHRKIGGCCLLFASGKMVSQGSKSYQQACRRVRQYARIISKLGYNVKLDPVQRVTATGMADIGCAVDLARIQPYLPNSTYEPELFSALQVKADGVHFAVFSSGKVTITGITHPALNRRVVLPMLLQIAML